MSLMLNILVTILAVNNFFSLYLSFNLAIVITYKLSLLLLMELGMLLINSWIFPFFI